VLDDGVLLRADREAFVRVLAPKVRGGWNLHALTADRPLDFFVLFSSAAALLGSPGQANYTAANTFLDALAQHRHALGLPALSINWGTWSEVGLAAARGERLVRGMTSMTPAEGVQALGMALHHDGPQIAIMSLDFRQWRQCYPAAMACPRLAELCREPQAGAHRRDSKIERELLALEPGPQRRQLLEAHLRDQIARVLRLDPVRIDAERPLGDLGFDSLMAVELRNRLEASLGLTLSTTMMWAYPTIAALVPNLAQKMGVALGADGDRPPDDGAASQLVAEESEEPPR
jgi:acyl carrier protein